LTTTRKSKQFVAAVAGFAIAAVGLLSTTAEAVLPPLSAPNGVATVAPASGTRTSVWGMTLPGGAACAGDSVTGNYLWSTFLVASNVDASQLTWSSGSPVYAANPAAVVQPLFGAGSPIINETTGLGDGAVLIAGKPIDLATYPANFIPAGQYKVGVACILGGATTEAFWQSTISIAVNGSGVITGYSPFAVPGAPTLTSPLTAGVTGTLSGTFTAPASTPATLSYLVTATPPSGPAITTTVAAPASAFTIGGLTNGIAYSVTVRTTNLAGTGAASNTVISPIVFDVNQRAAVTLLPAIPGVNTVALSWVAPTGVAPTGYSIAVPGVVGSPFTVAAGATSFTVPALCSLGALTFTVTPTHPAPFFGSPASLSSTALCDGTLIQDVTVVRPAGALVLTQRCGVFGPLPIELASPGFAQLTALSASGGLVGTAPTVPLVGADPQFGNYPNPSPVASVTRCGVDLGTAQYVTSGTLAGQYYAANGRINQVTVSDTRDTDTGWIASATMSNFDVVGGGSSFSGNYLGWSPVVTDDSDLTVAGYDQLAVAGASVLPTTAAGLATPKALATTAVGRGLGIATFDARLKLLIPVSARAGTYNGTLTFTVV
jgi:hypothetical protein